VPLVLQLGAFASNRSMAMLLFRLALTMAAAAWIGLGSAAFAASGEDIKQLKALLRSMGTTVVNQNCDDPNLWGFYELDPDRITMCINGKNVDSEEYWETLAHEATHVMQGCTGGVVIDDAHIARVYRELKAINKTSFKDVKGYESSQRRDEIEARWMELQLPSYVFKLLKKTCFDYIK
jgi:hypothetical protein